MVGVLDRTGIRDRADDVPILLDVYQQAAKHRDKVEGRYLVASTPLSLGLILQE